MVPVGMLAVLLVAAPALLAQEDPASAGSEFEATGTTYFARSEVVDLDSYDDGQGVGVSGTLVADGGYPAPILEVTRVEPLEDPSTDETATPTFELSVEGEPAAGAAFFGAVLGEGLRYIPLTDADGLYTGSTTASRFPPRTRPLLPDAEPVSLPVWTIQGTGTQGPDESDSLRPGEPISVVKDLGAVRTEDRTLSASISFEEDQGDTTTPDSSDDSSGSGSSDGSDDGLLGGVASRMRGFLPIAGGGAVLALLGAGILLTGGLLVRRLFR